MSQFAEFPALHDPAYPVHRIAGKLEPCLRAIVEAVQPEKIILFGSHAYGNPRSDSDVDLLVIRREIASELQSNLEIRRALRSVPGLPPSFTFISKNPETLARRLAEGSPFLREVVGHGLELYAT